MGQALRRATGTVRSARPPPAKPPKPPPPPPTKSGKPSRPASSAQDNLAVSDLEAITVKKDDADVLEERDPGYDSMLNKMVGTITSKPGGKLEMGEAFIVEKYNRPLPKVHGSKAETDGSEQKPEPPGSLTVAQLREIILLHQGKSEMHQGPMKAEEIANKFNIEVTHVKSIVQFVSLPPEDTVEDTQK